MALRELLLPWDAQPQEAARLRPEYADAVVYLPSVNPGALLNGVALTQGAPLAITNGGIAVAQQQRAKVNHSVMKLPNSAPNVTMFMLVANGAAYNNTASDRWCLGVDSGGTFLGYQSWLGGLTFTAGVYYSPDYSGAIFTDAAAVRQGHVQCVVATYVRNDMLRIYVDGTLYGSVAAGNYDCGLNPGGANAWAAGNSTTPLTGSLLCGGVMTRALSDTDARDLSLRGFGALFEPRRIFVPVSAGGGAAADLATTGNSGTFSGTANSPATATLAATGASGALSASAGTSASAALAATGDSGTLSASAYTPALASLAATGGSGIFVGSAFSEATAALSATGGSGTLSASAGAEASASLAATGGSGTLAADAFVQAVATLAATGVSGSLIASAWTTISATLSATGGSGELTASAGEPVVATRVLSSYRPLPPPADPKDVGRWAMNELLTIARHLADGRDFDLLNTIHAQPSKPREGMVVHADGTNWDPGSGAGRYERVGGAWVKLSGAAAGAEPEDIIVVCSDETTALTTGLAKATFRMPFDMTLQGVSASVTTAPTGAALIVDINDGASSVLSTKLSIDATERTSATAATPAVISDPALAEDAEITIDIDQVGSTIAGAGLKVTLRGVRA